MKSRLLNLFVAVTMLGSIFLAPAGMALAAPDWTCGSVLVTNVNDSTRNVTVALNHSTADNERIDLNWGDGSSLLVVHSVTTPTNSLYLPNSQSHTYAATGSYTVTMRVWNVLEGPPDNDNENGNDWHECAAHFTFNGCYGVASALSVSGIDPNKNVTATVSYVGNAFIAWGDGMTTTLALANQTNLKVTHHYAAAGNYTVQLYIVDQTGTLTGVNCNKLATFTPSDVTLSSMSAGATDGGINWAAIGFALLGLAVLGGVGSLAVIRRR